MHLSRFILRIFGWKVIGEFPSDISKAIVIAAPHTSNWDLFIGYAAYRALGIRARFLVKKEAFFFPLGNLIKAMGGIPVDRSPGNSTVDQVVAEMNQSDEFILTIAPEGTRSAVYEWKSGFWRICKATDAPLYLGLIDYKHKRVGLIKEFELSDEYELDILKIKTLYRKEWAKYPDKYI
jgi:1-acyl-sn-glycerol-3-phosphate acyltransferase